jgi:Ca2+-binding EF-hand superfamily protein
MYLKETQTEIYKFQVLQCGTVEVERHNKEKNKMGGGGTKQFVVNFRVEGQGEEILEVSRQLELSEAELNQYWTAFCKIDKSTRGQISLDDFHSFYQLDETPFSRKVFSMMDTDDSGMISFHEFVLSIWSYLSLDLDSLAKFSFRLYDNDNSNYMEMNEVNAMITCVYGSNSTRENSERIKKLLEKMEMSFENRITLDQFVVFSKQYPLLLYPAFMMQSILRRGIFGEAYWDGVAAERAKKELEKPIFDILKSHGNQQGLNTKKGRNKSAKMASDQDFKGLNSVTKGIE